MTTHDTSHAASPTANIRQRRGLSLVWGVPLAAAVVAAGLIGMQLRDLGPAITISFEDVSGLRSGQTTLQYRGVPIGKVKSIVLTPERDAAQVTVRLRRDVASIARQSTVFWIVRPQFGLGNISELGSVISGPHIETLPGAGGAQRTFVGLANPPAFLETTGLNLTLRSRRLGMLRANMPIYYRGIEVGAIQGSHLNSNATAAEIHASIRQRYAPLVRPDTKFWRVSGADVSFELFGGLEVSVESLRTLLAGGVFFATPDDGNTNRVRPGTVFVLHEKPDDEWRSWSPAIPVDDE